MKEEDEEDEYEHANGLSFNHNHWECQPLHSTPSISSSSSSSSHHPDLTVFPPINHEGLPISPHTPPHAPPHALPHAPPCLDSDSHLSSHPPQPCNSQSHFSKWVQFSLHLLNSKLLSVFTHLRFCGFFWSIRAFPVMAVASLVVLGWWVYRRQWRQQNSRVGDGVEQLKGVIKEKDEKIIKLLEQISQMNKVLLARYKVPVLKPS